MKKVLLARPSVFIVNDMKHLLTTLGVAPTPIKNVNEITTHPSTELAGAVISTALNSEVPEDYAQVAKALKDHDPNLPLLLATLVPFDNLVKALTIKFKNNGLDMDFLSMRAASRAGDINPALDVVVIHRDDITSTSNFETTVSTIRRFFR